MADNTIINAGSGGDQIRDVDKGGVKTPVGLIDVGGAGAEALLSAANPMPVGDAGGSLTVDGTITANAGSGTFAVSAAALPLPAGAATSAKQPALGTAGAAAADVLSIQGIASMTPVKVDGSGVTQPVSGTVGISGSVAVTGTFWQATQPISGNVGVTGTVTVGTHAVTQSGNWSVHTQDGNGNALTSVTRGAQQALSVQIVDASGNQVTSFGGSGGTASNFGSAFPASGTAIGAKDSSGLNMAALNLDASGNLLVNAGTVAVTGTFWQATQPISAASLPLPTGAALDTSVNGILLAQASTTAGQKGALVQGAVTTAAPTYTTAKTSPLSLDTAGNLRVLSNLAQVSGTGISLGQKTMSASLPVALASDQGTLPVSGSITANAGTGTFAVSGAVTANIGTSGSLALESGGNLATLAGGVSGGKYQVQPQAATSGGATPYHLISAATTNATSLKGSAGQVYAFAVFNTSAATKFVKFFDKASAPTLGTDTPVLTIPIPAGGGSNLSLPVGIAFASGIAFAITGAAADGDSTAVAAGDVVASILYK